MNSAARKILDEALALPDEERRLIAEALLDSTDAVASDEIAAAWSEEAQSRAGRLERGEVTARDGDEVLAEIEAKLRSGRTS